MGTLSGCEPACQGLKSVQKELSAMLTLEHRPIVIPSWQQLQTVGVPARYLQVFRTGLARDKPMRPGAENVYVDDRVRSNPQQCLIRLQDVDPATLEPPQCRP